LEKNSSIKLWECEHRLGEEAARCPREQPIHGSECSAADPVACAYPYHVNCRCEQDSTAATRRWSCDTRRNRFSIRSGPPEIPATKQVKDLSDAEATTWCTWLLKLNAGGAPEELPVSDEGYIRTSRYIQMGAFYAEVCLPYPIPVPQCVDNLKLAPCEATVAEMSDCALTAIDEIPSPHGCGRFREKAHCDQTIFNPSTPGKSDGTDAGFIPPSDPNRCPYLKVR
jgi:hypothetical protein